MAYYSHNHNLAYDLTLFEAPYENKTSAKFKKKSSGDAVAAENTAGENQDDTRTHGKNRVKSVRRKNNVGRIALGVILGIAVMAIIASIIHGQVQLTELSQEIVDARARLAEKQSEYTQLEMQVNSAISSTALSKYASENSMVPASNSQKEFVSLSEGDKAEVSMSEDKNLFEKIADAFSSLWS